MTHSAFLHEMNGVIDLMGFGSSFSAFLQSLSLFVLSGGGIGVLEDGLIGTYR